MRRLLVGVSGLCLVAVGYGCAAGEDDNNGGGGSTSTTQPSGGNGGTTFQGGNGTGGSGGFAECATFTAEATQEPAALLIVLDKSASMATEQKWPTALLSIVEAIDSDAFNSISLGMVVFPSSNTPLPDCLCDQLGGPGVCDQFLPEGVSCGVSVLPQVAMAPAGTMKSNEGGVRKSIYDYLANNAPLNNGDDGSPIYDAMVGGYMALKSFDISKRLLLVITDGGFSCTSVANPFRNGYQDANGCPDWEIPDTVNTLIQTQRDDPTKPVNTFFVGLPGSQSTGGQTGGFDTPPYHMRLALSTYAVTGSPDTVDPGCDASAMYTQSGLDPAVPCHIDLTTGTFNADTLTAAIAKIRGQALGCIYELPEPPQGETIDPGKVNVDLTVDGTSNALPKRADPANPCTDSGCWDYTDDGKVELIGKACEDVTNAVNGKVDIIVGCDTIIE